MRDTRGLTLIEMLIAAAIMGIVLAVIVSLLSGTLRFSSVAYSSAERLREMNDVTGYLSDSVRRASDVLTSGTSLNGQSCDISDAANPCFSVVVPEASAGPTIDTYRQLFYRLEARSVLPADYKVANTWADANTYVIKEYRHLLCDADAVTSAPDCDAATSNAQATLTGVPWYLIIDGLTLANGSGSFAPFAYDSATERFNFQFRVADHRRGETRYTPAAGTYQLGVVKRN